MNFRLASDKQISRLHEDPDAVDAFLFGADDEPTIAHDPSHDFQLIGVSVALDGGRPLGEARAFSSAEVAALAVKLRDDPHDELRNFITAAAAKKLGLITYVTPAPS